MRFLVITQYFPPEVGAPQTRLASFSRELRNAGHDVEIVTVGYKKLYEKDTWEGLPVHRCWTYVAQGTGIRRMFNYLSFTASSLLGIFRAKRADVVFVESPPLFLSISGWIAARFRFGRSHCRLIFNVADLWPDSVKELGVLKDGVILRVAERLERWTYATSDFVNSVTDGISATLARKGVPAEKILFLPNGVDTNVFFPREPDRQLIESLDVQGKHVLIYAGTHGIAQGLETLIEAARLLQDEPYVFLFVGDGGRKAAIQELAEKYALTNVRFVEPRPLTEMPRYFSIAYASVVPLLRLELFATARPSKIFPSLASAVPVIYSGEGEAANMLEKADAGVVVEPESPEALARAIRALGDAPERHAVIARNARAYALAEFAWPTIVQSWLTSLQNATPRHPAAIRSFSQFTVIAKRAIDIFGALVGIVIFSPIMLIATLAIMLDSGFPILFHQTRIGQGGRPFEIWKFRTMRTDADSKWVSDGDDRIMRVGRILRRTSMDELPQFFNVLTGSMSLVGPRPEMQGYSDEFARTIPEYATRYRVKPGITGYAQVYGPRVYSPSEIGTVLELDLTYVRSASLFLDVKLLFKTALEFLFQQAR